MIISGTINTAKDAITLTVSGASGATTIIRRDRNGIAAVRLPVSGAVVDYEVALTGSVRYIVSDASGSRAETTLTMPGTASPQIRRTYAPATAVTFDLILSMTQDQELRRSEHQVVNRDDTVVTTSRLGLRKESLTVLCASLTAARAVRRMYGAGQVVRLRAANHDGLDMHHLGTTISINRDSDVRWSVTVGYIEVIPAATRTLAPWTYADAGRALSTYLVAELAYNTYADAAGDIRPEQA